MFGDLDYGAPEPEVNDSVPEIKLDNPGPAVPEDVLDQRAARADFALGDKSPGRQALKDQFRAGGEQPLRVSMAGQADADFRLQKLSQIQKAAQQGAPITDDQVNHIMAIGTTPDANPETVIEDKFARGMVTAGVAGNPESNLVFQTAFEMHPDETRAQMQTATNMVSRKALAKSVLEDAEAVYKDLPWFGSQDSIGDQTDKSGELFKDVLSMGMASRVAQRNLLNDAPGNSFLPGNNKLEQIQYLYLLPHSEFKPALMAAAGPGSPFWKSNPGAALEFIKGAVAFSTADAYVDNVFATVDVASLIPAGIITKSIGRLRNGKVIEDVSSSAVQSLDAALETAQKNLAKAPEAAPNTWYLPEAAVKRPWETQPRIGETRVENGVPRIFTDDGAEVALSQTPEVGHIPVTVTEPTNVKSYLTRQGSFTPDERTVYMSKKDMETLSQSLDEDRNFTLLRDAKGIHVGDLDNARPGKMVPKSRVPNSRISTEPAEGLYPVRIAEGNDRQVLSDFGDRITKVEDGTSQNISFGPRIGSDEELQTRRAMADIVKAQGETHPQDVLSKMGQHEVAATDKAVQIIDDKFTKTVRNGDVEEIRRNVPSLASPQNYFNNASSLSAERARRLAEQAIATTDKLADAIMNPTRVERMGREALEQAVKVAKGQVASKYNRLSDSIVDQVTHWDSATNTYRVETKFVNKDGTPFESYGQAKHYQSEYGLTNNSVIQQEGNKFYLSHYQDVDETQSIVRNSLIVTENQTPRGWMNSLVSALTSGLSATNQGLGGSIRSAAYTQAPFQMNNRTVATHAPSVLRDAVEQASKDLSAYKFTKAQRHELQTILENNRDFMHPDGKRGEFYKSALEFETAFHARFGKMPTEGQIKAYDSYVRLSDLDWVLREMNWQRDKARQGIRDYKVGMATLDDQGLPGRADSGWFNGKKVPDFDPTNTQDANIYVMGRNEFHTKHDFPDDIKKLIAEGQMQIIQVYAPNKKPLKELTGIKDQIHFVVTDAFEDRAVQWGSHSEYRPGGHVINLDEFFLKTPNIGTGTKGKLTHFGDTTLKSFPTAKEAEFWAKKYTKALEFVAKNDNAGLQAYLNTGELPETYPQFMKMVGEGVLDPANPPVATVSARTTLESNEALAAKYPGLKDQFSSYNLAQTQDGTFLGERNAPLQTIANKGTDQNPIYVNVQSRLADPFSALQQGMAQIVRDRWMSDYRTSAAESWIQEFGHIFDQSKMPIERLRQNPTYWLYHAPGNTNSALLKTNPELVTAAMTARANIIQFLGARGEVGATLEGLERKLADSIESIAGQKAASVAIETVLPMIKDAPQYARQATFHTTIGLFNPIQLYQQAQGVAHVTALSPRNALDAATASSLARLYRYTENPAILSDMADKAAAMGWKRDEFIEAYNAWKSSGTHAIGQETATLSGIQDPKLFQGAGSWFLDKGLMFFKAGEAVVRDMSWFTAYRDWRQANPSMVLDNKAMGDITRRFDTLSMNMTRASNAVYNEGILSIPTQFWTWNARFFEQMTGKQLGGWEKARALTMYSALYGIPATLGGVTFGVIPGLNYQDIREYAIANNINVSDKFYKLFSEGLPTMILDAITGKENDLQRFGPNATQVKDILDGKKSAWQVLGGATGNWVSAVMSTVYPAGMYMYSAMKGDSKFPLTMNDLVNAAESVKSFDNTARAVIGYNLGTYIAKNEMNVTELDKYESIMVGLGINPKRIQDAYTKQEMIKAREANAKFFQKKVLEDYNIALKAGVRGDFQTMSTYMTRVQAYNAMAGFTKQEELDNWKMATRGVNASMVDRVESQWQQRSPELQKLPQLKKYLDQRMGK